MNVTYFLLNMENTQSKASLKHMVCSLWRPVLQFELQFFTAGPQLWLLFSYKTELDCAGLVQLGGLCNPFIV